MSKKPTYEKLEQRVKRLEREMVEGKQADEILRENEQRYQALSDATFDAVFILKNGVCVETNYRATEMFGYAYDELIGIFGSDVIAPESKELVQRHMLSGYEKPYEVLAQRKDETTFYAEIRGKMMQYKGSAVRVTVVHEIDKYKRAEIALQKSEERFRHLIEGSIQGVLIHRKLEPVFVNQAYADIFGYTIKEIIAMDTVFSMFADHEHDRLRGYMDTRLKGKEAPIHYECQGIQKDGTLIWLENRVTMAEGWKKNTIQVTVFDITDRKRAEAALKKRSHELDFRVKELNCLYTISKNLELSQNSGFENYQHIVDIITSALRYPGNACACINIEGHEWKTKNFKETEWKIKSDIVSYGERIGSLEIYSLEEKPVRGEGFFEKTVRDLINEIAQRLGKTIESLKDKEALRESEEKLHYLSSGLLRAQEKERQRISLGLHDDLGQDLAALKMRLKSIESRLRNDQKRLKETCKSTLKYVDRIVENVRRISHGLSPMIIQDLGLSAALKWMIQNFAEQTHIEVSLGMINIDNLFSEETQIIIYRVFQEVFTNIRKHSRATLVSVEISKEKNSVSFAVEDNGSGFDMREVAARNWPEKGMGLTALEERARILGGPFERFSRKGQGTRVSLTIPINKEGSGQ